MVREIRKIKSRAKSMYIRQLQWRKNIKAYVNEHGYICYDPDELKEYNRKAKKGRPLKINKEN